MALTISQLTDFITSAQRAYAERVWLSVKAEKKGSRRYKDALAHHLLAAQMLPMVKRWVPPGTVVVPAIPGEAVFDLSPYATTLIPNVNDIRIDVVRLDMAPITLADGRFDRQGLNENQWVAQIATAITAGASTYTGSSTGTTLNVEEPDGSTDTGDVRLRIYPYVSPSTNAFYTYFDWGTISPGFTSLFYGGVVKSPTLIYLLYNINPGNFIALYDGTDNGISSQIVTGVTGIPSPPIASPWIGESNRIYYCNTTTGLVEYIETSGSFSSYGVAVTPASTNADSKYDAVTDNIYFINGGNYVRIRADHTVFISTAVGIPDDEFLTLNTDDGTIFSYSAGNNTLSFIAFTGVVLTQTLVVSATAINPAGRIGYFNNTYYVPREGTRRVYLFNTSFVGTAFIDFSTVTGWTITADVLHCEIHNDLLYVIHTDGNVSVIDPANGAFLNTFYTGTNAGFFFSAGSSVFFSTPLSIYTISPTDEVSLTEEIQSSQGEIVWTEADNCLTEEQQQLMMGKLRRFWNTTACANGASGGDSPVASDATIITTSDGFYVLDEQGNIVVA